MEKYKIDKAQAEDMLHTFELLAGSIGKPTNEYGWRSFIGHIKALEDAGVKNVYRENLLKNPPKNNGVQSISENSENF